MLARYKLYRGKRPADDPLPDGVRMDTRKHTRHILRPEPAMVEKVMATKTAAAWDAFARDYLALLDKRLKDDPAPFEALAERARHGDVYIGCSCPSSANPELRRCHTVLALQFMRTKYPDLQVVMPT